MDLQGPIIGKAKSVGGPIVTFCKYQIKFNDYLKEFKVNKEGLRSRKRDIELKLGTELHHGKVAKEEVQRWLKDVEEFIASQDVEDEVNGVGCLSCSPRVKILEERAKELKEIYDRGHRYTNECLVIDDPSALEMPASELQGSGDVKMKILTCLKGEEVTKLGVLGMAGVGKTTIMMQVYNELLKESKFKKIIWVTLSQYFDIYKLQEQIACSFGVQLPKDQTIVMRAARLAKMLEEDKHKPYLLILDGVWRSFELLKEVGVPEPDVTNGCKLVLTTQSQEIARLMGCRIIKVNTLSPEEALKLFLDKVGEIVLLDHGGGIKRDIESTLMRIVDECDGLPLAIVTVAGSLKDISEAELWSAALNQLRDCKRNVAGTNDGAFGILKFSYDRLKNPKMQHCFLYCALYPEDCYIPKETIIECWIDEGFIDEMETRQAMKDEGHDILRKLEDNSLLESIGRFGEDCVRMHTLVRDMALHITTRSSQFLVEAGKELRELPESVKWIEDFEKVSLMWNCIEEIPSSMASSTCTKLTTLLLTHNYLRTIPESIFEHMSELKILDLSFNNELRSLPNSISKLVKLIILLLESTSLEKVPSLSSLVSLKRLNLRKTKLKEVPQGLDMLMNLKCLVLCGRPFDWLEINEIPDGVFSNLSKLEELFVDWRKIRLKGGVIGRLTRLEVFHGQFPTGYDMSIFGKCLPNRLSRYFIAVGRNYERRYIWDRTDFRLKSSDMSRTLEMLPRYQKIMAFVDTSIVGENMLLPSVQVLWIGWCHKVRSLNDISSIEDVTDLRRCCIKECDGMEWIISSWTSPVVQTLEYLKLDGLDNLDGVFETKAIANSAPPPPGTFSSLKTVEIGCCKKIKKLFPSWMLVQYLQNLEEIVVKWCEELKEIIVSDDPEEERRDIKLKLILPKLKRLELWRLPALKSICSKRAVMVCDSLEQINISRCVGLRRIPLYLDDAQPSPPLLKSIKVFPKKWWESLEWDYHNSKNVLSTFVEFSKPQ